MNHSISCRCARVRGFVSDVELRLNRSICYCRDCQAYARHLGRTEEMLDEHGGTSVVAVQPRQVHFTEGQELVVCMSLGEKGLLRWYARCCKTAIGNTPRDFKLAFVGLVETCLEGTPKALERSFGAVDMRLNVKSARGALTAMKEHKASALWRTLKSIVASRLTGRFRVTPFFESESGRPICVPQVLSQVEREELLKP